MTDALRDLPDGEMVRLVRQHDWAATALGPIEGWPTALLTTARLVLACRLPMYVAWGPSLVQLYNDAYRPILGDKHPALGMSTWQTWPEIWPRIGPMWQEVMAGKPVGFDDFKLTINRFGYDEDCFFNFSYSPAYDDAGAVAGVLVTFAETTEKVRTANALRLQQRHLQLALDSASMGWWHYDPVHDRASWDPRFQEIFGIEVREDPRDVALQRILPEDRDKVWAQVQASLDPSRREHFAVEYRIEHPRQGRRWIEAKGIGSFSDEDPARALALVGTVRDVTESRAASDALRDSEALAKAAAERLSLALSAGGMGDWSWDAASDVVTLSSRAAAIFGVPEPQVTWRQMRELLHPEDAPRAEAAVLRSLDTRTDYDMEYRLLPGERARWVLARGRPLYEAGGRPTGMIGVVQDITGFKELEQALKARTETLGGVLDTAAAIAAEHDVGRLVQRVTDTATRVTNAAFGAFFYNVLDESGGAYMLYALSGVDASHFDRFPMPRATALFGPTFRGEGVIRIADVREDARYGQSEPYRGMPPGHLPVVSYLAVPVVSRSGEVLGGLFFGHSQPGRFTEAHEDAVRALAAQAAVAMDNARLHDRARRNLEVAENAGRMKDEFLATVSHELRTPLTSIVGWIHMLRTGKLGAAEHHRALESIERNVKAQQRIIDDILDVSRIVAGKLRIELVPIELVASIEGAIQALQPLIDAKRIELVRLFDSAVMVLGDAARMQQVVWNLVANAIKYTPRGGRIKVILRRDDSEVELRVADNGEGIDAAFLPHVFERFRQADSSTTRAHGGIGLGLAIVRHLVELHGGTVAARSDGRGRGSEFLVRLPLAPAWVPRRPQSPAPAASAREWNLRGVRALVLDDEHDTRVMLAAVLASAGVTVSTAGEVGEALALLDTQPHDIVISDIGMPRQDGYAFARQLRQHPRAACRELPAIALTAYARPEDRIQALASGFQAHLAKPAQPEELLATVASLVGRAGVAS